MIPGPANPANDIVDDAERYIWRPEASVRTSLFNFFFTDIDLTQTFTMRFRAVIFDGFWESDETFYRHLFNRLLGQTGNLADRPVASAEYLESEWITPSGAWSICVENADVYSWLELREATPTISTQTFIADAQYTPPASAVAFIIRVWGAGGGGGGGGWRGWFINNGSLLGAFSGNPLGGAGGAGGSYTEQMIILQTGDDLGTLDITIGQGGAGGAGQPSVSELVYNEDELNDTLNRFRNAGAIGADGGDTTITNLITAKGGKGAQRSNVIDSYGGPATYGGWGVTNINLGEFQKTADSIARAQEASLSNDLIKNGGFTGGAGANSDALFGVGAQQNGGFSIKGGGGGGSGGSVAISLQNVFHGTGIGGVGGHAIGAGGDGGRALFPGSNTFSIEHGDTGHTPAGGGGGGGATWFSGVNAQGGNGGRGADGMVQIIAIGG